jgi:hypothetical protein
MYVVDVVYAVCRVCVVCVLCVLCGVCVVCLCMEPESESSIVVQDAATRGTGTGNEMEEEQVVTDKRSAIISGWLWT